jgi:23S rRNA pseudouridine2605 synthase
MTAVLATPAHARTGRPVKVDGKALPEARRRGWRYHKPKGLVTSHKDPQGRPTVFAALPSDLPRVVSVGRLDLNTEGLLLLTNDGALARHLELPATGWLRRYRVRAYGRINQEALDRLKNGVTIEGVHYGPVEAKIDRELRQCWLLLGHEGKNRGEVAARTSRAQGQSADPLAWTVRLGEPKSGVRRGEGEC